MKHGRRDLNHAEIRDGLRKLGWSVIDTADLGDGFPDLVAGVGCRTYLLEIKSVKGKERDCQTKARESWKGGAWAVVYSLEDVLELQRKEMGRR